MKEKKMNKNQIQLIIKNNNREISFNDILLSNVARNDQMNNPVLHKPPVSFGQLIAVEEQPTKVEHSLRDLKFNEDLKLKLSEKYAVKEQRIEGSLISNNTIRFEFDN